VGAALASLASEIFLKTPGEWFHLASMFVWTRKMQVRRLLP
jgi:hypothetical protein